MERKKTIIVLFGVVFLFVIIALFMIFSKKKTTNNPSSHTSSSTSSGKTTSSTQNNQSAPPSFPVNDSSTQNNNVNPRYDKLELTNANNPTETKKEFVDFLSTDSKQDLVQVTDQSGQVVSLGTFANSMNFKVNSEINGIIKPNDYQIVRCSKGTDNIGVVLNIKLFPERPSIYQDANKMMKNWENTTLQDMHAILFPNANFTDSDINQKITFKDGKYRYADITLPGGSKGSINYNIVFDSIIITNSLDCLSKISLEAETLEP